MEIKELNQAISTLKTFCSKQRSCNMCPFNKSCGNTPENWKLLEEKEHSSKA